MPSQLVRLHDPAASPGRAFRVGVFESFDIWGTLMAAGVGEERISWFGESPV